MAETCRATQDTNVFEFVTPDVEKDINGVDRVMWENVRRVVKTDLVGKIASLQGDLDAINAL
jgi:hypothetical protein